MSKSIWFHTEAKKTKTKTDIAQLQEQQTESMCGELFFALARGIVVIVISL